MHEFLPRDSPSVLTQHVLLSALRQHDASLHGMQCMCALNLMLLKTLR